MKHAPSLLASILLAVLAAPALPDTVVLKSSDTLTGSVVRITPDTIDLQTNFAGLLHIQARQGQNPPLRCQGHHHQRRGRIPRRIHLASPRSHRLARVRRPQSAHRARPHRHPRDARNPRRRFPESGLSRPRTLVPPHRPPLEKPAHARRPRHLRQHRLHQHRRPGRLQIRRKAPRNQLQDRRRLRHHQRRSNLRRRLSRHRLSPHLPRVRQVRALVRLRRKPRTLRRHQGHLPPLHYLLRSRLLPLQRQKVQPRLPRRSRHRLRTPLQWSANHRLQRSLRPPR